MFTQEIFTEENRIKRNIEDRKLHSNLDGHRLISLDEIVPMKFDFNGARHLDIFDNLTVKLSNYNEKTISLSLRIGIEIFPDRIKLEYAYDDLGKKVYTGNFEPICIAACEYNTVDILFTSYYEKNIEVTTKPVYVPNDIVEKMIKNRIININTNDVYGFGFFSNIKKYPFLDTNYELIQHPFYKIK